MYKDVLIRNLHKVDRGDALLNEFSGSMGAAFDEFDAALKDFTKQLDIDTATWGLAIYEKELGIKTIAGKPLDERRSVIIGKLRGDNKIGAEEIKLVADSWSHGDVEVMFDGKIRIKFSSIYGVPNNIEDVKNEIRKICPAHLDVVYSFKYTLYNDIKSKNMTYDELKNTNITYKELMNGGLG